MLFVFFVVSVAKASTGTVETKRKTIKDLPLGQLLIVGFKGKQISEGLDQVLRETKPGGILLFGRNVESAEQVAALTFAAQGLSKKVSNTSLLVAIDQEGGNVIRIRNSPTLPSALAIAKTRDLSLARRAGAATGRLLRTLGINVNLAPVVDVSDPETDQFLGTRSFGNDPSLVAAMSTSLATGLQENGVMPIAKHFPGHGDASGDSHLVASQNLASRQQLFDRDLLPYFSFEKFLKRPWGTMLAHVSFPTIDPTNSPATFSKSIVGGLFRQEISRSALILTDDIEMAGASVEGDVGQRAVRAIEAGADMVMIAWSRKIQRQVTIALREALHTGRLKRSRVEEALKHIAAAQKAYVPRPLIAATKDDLNRSFKNPDFTKLGEAVLRAAARNIGARRSPLLVPGPEPVIVLSARSDFLKSFKNRAAGFNITTALLKPSKQDAIERLLRANPESPVFVYVSGRQVAAFVSGLDNAIAAKMILINVETNASITNVSRFRDVFDLHYRHPNAGRVVAESYLDLSALKLQRTAASQQLEPTQ